MSIGARAPFAPHFGEDLWERTGHSGSVFDSGWPAHDPALAKAESVTVVIQVKGKVRSRVDVPADIDDEAMKKLALENDRIQEWIAGKDIKRVIVVPKKLVNIVV